LRSGLIIILLLVMPYSLRRKYYLRLSVLGMRGAVEHPAYSDTFFFIFKIIKSRNLIRFFFDKLDVIVWIEFFFVFV
jgi:hypothetical protein